MDKISQLIILASSLVSNGARSGERSQNQPGGQNYPQFSLDQHQYGLPGGTIGQILQGILSFLLLAVGILSIIGFLIAGILYLTSGGSEERVSRAKNAFIYSIIGVIVALSGYVALQAAYNFLGSSPTF